MDSVEWEEKWAGKYRNESTKSAQLIKNKWQNSFMKDFSVPCVTYNKGSWICMSKKLLIV